jgi:hypothetical protein
MADTQRSQAIDMKFKRPDSVVVSLRLNADESRKLTGEARRAGEKLSTFIKAAALETVARRHETRRFDMSVGGGEGVSVVLHTSPADSTSAGREADRLSSDANGPDWAVKAAAS